jgi:hypothetical protein
MCATTVRPLDSLQRETPCIFYHPNLGMDISVLFSYTAHMGSRLYSAIPTCAGILGYLEAYLSILRCKKNVSGGH